jgi:hypothetical protein
MEITSLLLYCKGLSNKVNTSLQLIGLINEKNEINPIFSDTLFLLVYVSLGKINLWKKYGITSREAKWLGTLDLLNIAVLNENIEQV